MEIVYTIQADEQTVERERRPTSDLKQHLPAATTLTETLLHLRQGKGSSGMDTKQFWSIIRDSRERAISLEPGSIDAHIRTLSEILRELSPEEVMSFQSHFTDCLILAYRNDLWGAAYWLFGGCGDDKFWDFRSCLISMGKDTFDRVLADPDSLAEIEDDPNTPHLLYEGFQYVPGRVYEELSGKEIQADRRASQLPSEPAGPSFDYDDKEEMARRFPKLLAKYALPVQDYRLRLVHHREQDTGVVGKP